MADPVVILSAVRTPMGAFQGVFQNTAATQLGAVAIHQAIARGGLSASQVQHVMMGCVLQAGLGQAPARQAALHADCAPSTACVTVNKVCGSGMVAVMQSANALQLAQADFIIAGGMENMTRAPYLLLKARAGYRLGHEQVLDHMFFDGLEDAYNPGQLMGQFAEETAATYSFSRAAQDAYAIESLARAQAAQSAFTDEIAPVTVKDRQGEQVISHDEVPQKARPDKIPQLKPAFKKDGTVTAANASSIADGAAALALTRLSVAEQQGLTPLAKIVGQAVAGKAPEWFTTAPVDAIHALLKQVGWTVADVDLFEVNEAFAVVAMAAMQDCQIPHEKLNIHGGACALGHPIGASGTRVLVTLIHALKQKGLKRGIAALCIGGGEATAVAIELL